MGTTSRLLSWLTLILLGSQLFHLSASVALPNALPARHPPEPQPATAPAAENAAPPATKSGLGLLGIGPVHEPPASAPSSNANAMAPAPPAVPAAADAAVAPVGGVAQTVVENAGAMLGADACAANGECAKLGEAVVSAVEGAECRQLHVSGKCPAKCLAGINAALEHKLWNACAARCETDVVSGAAQRWVRLCEARQVTLLDQGKEAVKSLVVASPAAGLALRAVLILAVLLGAVMIGYRRGLLQGHALRLQKRMKKRNSERSFV